MKKYQQIEDYILKRIKSGKYSEDGKIESVEELCELFDVSHITVQKALSELKNKDFIYRKKGTGTFIKGDTFKKKNKKISLIIPVSEELPDSSILAISKGAKMRADQLGYDFNIEICNVDTKNMLNVPEAVMRSLENVISRGVDALALYVFYSVNGNRLYENYKIPIVMIDVYDESAPCSCVTANNRDGEIIAVNYLIEKGHSKIAILLENGWKITEKERVRGYISAMKRAGYAKNIKIFNNTKEDFEKIAEEIKKGNITAVAAINDYRAVNLMDYLYSQKIRIPIDCSIIGFDDNDVAKFCSVPLTTIKQNFNDIGICAINILDEYLSGQPYMYRKILSPVKLIERESVIPFT